MEVLSFYISAFLLILFCTAFVKLVTALSIFRYGLGLNSAPFGLVVMALSLVLSLLVVEPQINSAGGINALISSDNIKNAALEEHFAPFMVQHTDVKVSAKLEQIVSKNSSERKSTLLLKISAFMISELSAAFLLGLIVIIPFLVIDLLTANVLAALSINSVSSSIISLPIKLLLFVTLDGWLLITEKLLGGYF